MIAEARKRLAAGETPRTEAGRRITGTVRLAPSPGATTPVRGTLFIIARKGDGPPLAVKRIADPSFPLAFALGPEDAMLRGTALGGDVKLTARLKRDGTTGPAVPGDLEGTTRTPVTVGRSGVEIVLHQVR